MMSQVASTPIISTSAVLYFHKTCVESDSLSPQRLQKNDPYGNALFAFLATLIFR